MNNTNKALRVVCCFAVHRVRMSVLLHTLLWLISTRCRGRWRGRERLFGIDCNLDCILSETAVRESGSTPTPLPALQSTLLTLLVVPQLY